MDRPLFRSPLIQIFAHNNPIIDFEMAGPIGLKLGMVEGMGEKDLPKEIF